MDIIKGSCQAFPVGVGLIAMDELVFCLPEKKWMSIYVHLVLPEAALTPEAALPPGTCPAEPLRTGECNRQV